MKFQLGFLSKLFRTPLDRAAWGVIGLCSVMIGGILWMGDRTVPQVVQFSWDQKTLSLQDPAFTLTFDQPMDWSTVKDNLKITPELPGKISYHGQQLAYTLTDLPLYGTEYHIELQGALERSLNPQQTAKPLQPFKALVRTRDLAFAYLGVEGREQGRLILYNVTQAKEFFLTPPDLVVTNFEPYANGELIALSAYDRSEGQNIASQKLYTVTTGLKGQDQAQPSPYGRLTPILEANDYQNLNFDVADQSDVIVIERVNRRNPSDQGLWVIPGSDPPRPLGMQGQAFQVSPEGRRVAIAQQQGVTLIPLTRDGGSWQFFPDYQQIVGFSRHNPTQVLMVKENGDLTRSLVLVGMDQTQQEILTTRGQILNCVFEPRRGKLLYCVRTEPLDSNQTQEQIFLTLIDVDTATDIPLVALANDPNVKMNISPDGRNLLFDQVSSEKETLNPDPRSRNRPFPSGNLWLLTLPDLVNNPQNAELVPPEKLTLGLDPQWIP